MNAQLSRTHFLLALAVVAIWGSNFVVIKLALDHLPPLLFATLRFAVVFFALRTGGLRAKFARGRGTKQFGFHGGKPMGQQRPTRRKRMGGCFAAG